MLATKDAEAEPAGTVMFAGTETALLLLLTAMANPPFGAGPERAIVHWSESEPVMELLLQVTALIFGADCEAVPVPLRLTAAVPALLEIVNCPVAGPEVDGLNWTDRVSDCPDFRVAGRLAPETENPVPAIEPDLIVTAEVPVDVTVTDFDAAVPTAMFPKFRFDVLRVNAGAVVLDAFN